MTRVVRSIRWPVLGLVAFALLVGGSSLAGAAGRRAGSGRAAAPGIGSEITALRTEYSNTVQTASGQFTTTFATHSVNYRDARGSWQPIGADLVPGLGGGWASGPNRFSATFKAMAGAGLAKLTAGGISFTLAPEGVAPSIASAAGREVSYAAAFPHVDLSYAAEADSVKETLLLSSASAPTVYRFLLQPLGGARLSVMQASDGGWVFSREDLGSPLFRLDQPFAIDGVGSTPTGQTPVTMAIVASGTGFAVTLSLSRDWLTDPARKFPVAIDPSVSISGAASDDVYYPWLYTGSGPYTAATDWVGSDSSMTYRTALRFDLGNAIPAGASIESADLQLHYAGCGGCPYEPVTDAYVLTHDFIAYGGYYSPSALTTEASPVASVKQFSYTTALDWPITQVVRDWVSGARPNDGLLLRDAVEQLGSGDTAFYGKRYTGNASATPQLVINWTGSLFDATPPTVSGQPTPGQTLSATSGTWYPFNDPTINYSYQWSDCGYRSGVMADGPSAYFRLGEPAGSGTVVDSSGGSTGYVNGGVSLGQPGALPEDSNTSAYFNGSGGAIVTNRYTSDATAYALEAWVKDSGVRSMLQMIVGFPRGPRLEVGGTGAIFRLLGSNGQWDSANGTTNIVDGQWHHLVGKFDGAWMWLYVDGHLDAATHIFTAGAATGYPLWIGGNDPTTDSPEWFQGSIDEPAFYQYDTAASMEAAHYARTRCAPISGATGSTYTVQGTDNAQQLQVAVTAHASNGDAVTVNSAPTSWVANSNPASPVVTSTPVVSPIGSAAVGQPLTATAGTWTNSPTSYAYQWQRCTTYENAVRADSPIAYWHLDESSGTRAVDASSNGNDGAYAGGVQLGKSGALSQSYDGAALFPQAGTMTATLPQIVTTNGTWTSVEFWMYWNGTYYEMPVSFGGPYDIQFWNGYLGFNTSNGDIYGTSARGLDNRWVHVVAEFANGNVQQSKLYFNGVQQSLSQIVGSPATGHTASNFMVSGWTQGGQLFDGRLDEVAIYNGALSTTQVQAHYNAALLPCANIAGATSSTYTPVAADQGNILQAVVTATNGSGAGQAASTRTDNVLSAAPVLGSPDDGSGVPTITPVLELQGSAATGTDYEFEVASDSAFTQNVNVSDWQPATTSYTVPTGWLVDGKTYYWRARSRDSHDQQRLSAWSSVRSLVVRVQYLGASGPWPLWTAGPLAVNETNGNLVLSVPGPVYPTAAGSLAFSATYNSTDSSADKGFGVGWTPAGGDETGSPPTKLVDHSKLTGADQYDAVEVDWPDGGTSYYTHVAGTDTYQSEPGDESVLSHNPGTPDSWTLTDTDGSIYSFGTTDATGAATLTSEELVSAQPGKSTLTYAFTGTKLTRVTDGAPGSSRALSLYWNSLAPSQCPNAILCVTGPDGVTWRYIGDGSGGTSGRLVRVNDGTRDLLAIGYDGNGRPVTLQNADDLNPPAGYDATHNVAIAYDGSGRVASISEGPIHDQTTPTSTWSFSYDPGGTSGFISARNPHPNAGLNWNSDGSGTPSGYTTITAPDQQSQGSPAVTTVYYDSLGHAIERRDPLGNVTQAGWNDQDEQLWSEDAAGNPTDNSWDTVDNILLQTTGPSNGGARPVVSYRYDETAVGTGGTGGTPGPTLSGLQAWYYPNQVLAARASLIETDPNVNFSWGTSGPPGLNQAANYSVRWNGNINIGGAGDYTFNIPADSGAQLTIDGLRVINNWSATSASDVYSQPIQLNPGLHKLVLAYHEGSGSSNVSLHWACADCSSSFGEQVVPPSVLVPAWDNETSVVSPGGRLSFSHYAQPWTGKPDYSLVRLSSLTGAVAPSTDPVTSFTYDSYGRVIEKDMPKGNASRSFDSAGNLQGSPDTTYSTIYAYYAPGAQVAPAGSCGGGGVDQAQQLASTSAHGLAAVSYVYDAGGRVVSKTNGLGTTCFHYDAEGRLTSEQAPGDAQATTFTYDPSGNELTATNASGTLTTSYDEAGRVKQATDSWGASLAFGYDSDGNVVSRVATPAGGSAYTTSYTYDAADELVGETDPAGRSYGFFYDSRGDLHATQYPNGTFSWSDVNPLGEVTGLYNRHGTLAGSLQSSVPADSSPIADFAYSYNADGQKVQEVRSGAGGAAQTTSYGYDNLGRLDQVALPTGVCRDYGYDLDSNRTLVQESPTGCGGVFATTASYSYNPAVTAGVDQLSSVTASSAVTAYGYTADGQVSSENANSLSWDGWGRISGGSFPGGTVSYGYDAGGGLRSRVSGGSTTRYLLGDLFETDASGNLTTSYVDGPAGDLASFNGPPSPVSAVTYLYYDGHGDLAAEANSSGTVTATHTYDPFGAPLDAPPANATSHRFTGAWNKQYDSTNGLVLMGARPYDPTLGRFLAVDPVDGGSANAYDYCNQDPINCYDINGTNIIKAITKAVKKVVKKVVNVVTTPVTMVKQTAQNVQASGANIAPGASASPSPSEPSAFSGQSSSSSSIMGPINEGAVHIGGGAVVGGLFGCAAGAMAASELGPGGWIGGCLVSAVPGARVGAVAGFYDWLEPYVGPLGH